MAAPRDPVLLLHGQPGSARDWERVQTEIGERAKTIAIDRPGWDGASTATDLHGNALAALAALDARGIDRATVVGHSFGAAVAAWLAVHHPERVGALVLAAPSANVASLYELDRWLAAPVAGYLLSAVALGSAGAALIAGPLRRRVALQLAVDDRYLRAAAMRLLSPAAWRSFVLEQRVLISDLPLLEADLSRIIAKTTIVAGTRDAIVPPASYRQLAEQIPSAELRLVQRAGHLLPLRNAGALAELVLVVAV